MGKILNREKIIALDFDGCIMTDKYPEVGEPIMRNIKAIKKEIKKGAKVILWTCRCGESLNQAIEFCKKYGIELTAVNENLPEINAIYNSDSRKILADEYWDDKSILRCGDIILYIKRLIKSIFY